jgi:ketosteroid isomerase-like protein
MGENEEILQRLFEAWNRRDFDDGVLRYFDGDVEFHPGLLPPGEDTRYHGREGVRKWINNVNDAWVATTVEPKERVELASDRILSIDLWRFEGRGGIEVSEELPTAVTFRNGLIVRIDGYTDKAEAFEALGLGDS